MSNSEDKILCIAWYKRDQWDLLRELSIDSDKLEETYDEWLTFAEKKLQELDKMGISYEKIEVNVEELNKWCQTRGCPLDGGSRSEYAIYKARQN